MSDFQITKMPESDFLIFQEEHFEAQAPDLAKSFNVTLKRAREISREQFEQVLPHGYRTKDHFFYQIRGPQNQRLGHLWFCLRDFFGTVEIFLCDILISPEHRSQGLGKIALRWLENHSQELGFQEVSLHVFGSNTRARKLYESLGYVPTSIHLSKRF